MTDNALALFGEKDAALPAHLADAAPVGNENVDSGDIQIPRLNLLQAMSPLVEEVEGAKAGKIHNSISDELYDEIYVVNVYYDKEFTVFKDRSLGNEFGGSYPTREDAQAHIASEYAGREGDYNIVDTGKHAVLAMTMDGDPIGPAMILCSGSKMYFSRRWNTDIERRCSGKPRFGAVWKLSTVKQKNDKGSWYNFKTEFVGWTPEELFDESQKLYDAIK